MIQPDAGPSIIGSIEQNEGERVSEAHPSAPSTGLDAGQRYRYESELRRLRREIELRDETSGLLHERLRAAEREAAGAGGAVVDAMGRELEAWRDRATAAEAELAALRATVLYRLASPLLTLYRVRRRLPALARSVVRRLG